MGAGPLKMFGKIPKMPKRSKLKLNHWVIVIPLTRGWCPMQDLFHLVIEFVSLLPSLLSHLPTLKGRCPVLEVSYGPFQLGASSAEPRKNHASP